MFCFLVSKCNMLLRKLLQGKYHSKCYANVSEIFIEIIIENGYSTGYHQVYFWPIKLVCDNSRLIEISKFSLGNNKHFEQGNSL